VSNAAMNAPWPKSLGLKAELAQALGTAD
jgi:uncharacterized protein with NRDE domain